MKASTFTTHVDPNFGPSKTFKISLKLVEPPGTAPGSVTPISQHVYHYSQPKLTLGI